jgi:GntR family transcriptional regulator
MIFALNASAGVPVYLQIMQQVRHAVDTGVLQHGDPLPGIRTLAQELVVSHNTVAKAYSELQHEGLIDLRHGSGAYISARRGAAPPAEKVRRAQHRIRVVVATLLEEGFPEESIRRLFEAELMNVVPARTPSPR